MCRSKLDLADNVMKERVSKRDVPRNKSAFGLQKKGPAKRNCDLQALIFLEVRLDYSDIGCGRSFLTLLDVKGNPVAVI